MLTRGIRGAITVDENTPEAIKAAVMQLFNQIIKKNFLKEKQISFILFTVTDDLDAAYPAKFLRTEFGWNNTAIMCLQEMNVKNSLRMCLRVLIVVNCLEDFLPKYVYLKGAENLRVLSQPFFDDDNTVFLSES